MMKTDNSRFLQLELSIYSHIFCEGFYGEDSLRRKHGLLNSYQLGTTNQMPGLEMIHSRAFFDLHIVVFEEKLLIVVTNSSS